MVPEIIEPVGGRQCLVASQIAMVRARNSPDPQMTVRISHPLTRPGGKVTLGVIRVRRTGSVLRAQVRNRVRGRLSMNKLLSACRLLCCTTTR